MSCKDKCGFPIEHAPIAPGGDWSPCGPRPPRPRPCPPIDPGCPPSIYVGARYVPKFADPIEWDINAGYESLTIVTYKGESYTSKCPVPPDIEITNTRYWALTGAYNAQVKEYQEQVKDLSSQVSGFASDNAEFREKIDGYDKDNAAMKNTVADCKARVDNLSERVATAEGEIDSVQASLNQHTKDIADLRSADSDLQRQITSNDNDIAAIQAKDRAQDARLDGLDSKTDATNASVSQNTADIARNTKNIQDNAQGIADNAAELKKHATQLKEHTADIAALHKDTQDNKDAIKANKGLIDGLRADLTEDEAKISQNADQIEHIKGTLSSYDTRITRTEEKNTTQDSRLDAVEAQNTKQDTLIEKNTQNIKGNADQIAANAAELETHASQLTDHERRITKLETDVHGLDTKNAQQDAAIANVNDRIDHLELIDPAEYDKTIKAINDKDAEQDAKIAELEAKEPDLSAYVTKTDFDASQKVQDTAISKKVDLSDTGWDALSKKATSSKKLDRTTLGYARIFTTLNQNNAQAVYRDASDLALMSDIPDVSGFATSDEITAVDTKANTNAANIGAWTENHPGKTVSEAVSENTNSITGLHTDVSNLEVQLENTAKKTDLLGAWGLSPIATGFTATELYCLGRFTSTPNSDGSTYRVTLELILPIPMLANASGIQLKANVEFYWLYGANAGSLISSVSGLTGRSIAGGCVDFSASDPTAAESKGTGFCACLIKSINVTSSSSDEPDDGPSIIWTTPDGNTIIDEDGEPDEG